MIGIPILIIVIVVVVRTREGRCCAARQRVVDDAPAHELARPSQLTPPPRPEPLRGKLEALRRPIPAFSIVVFEDFLYFLYAEMHRARGAGGGEALAAYVADYARARAANDGRIAEVNGIIIGAMTYERVDVDPTRRRADRSSSSSRTTSSAIARKASSAST